MYKVEVIEEFTLAKFDKLKNIVRYNPNKNEEGKLHLKDTFECDEEMKEYLIKTNAKGRPFVKVIEIIPEKETEKTVKEKTRKTTKKQTSVK